MSDDAFQIKFPLALQWSNEAIAVDQNSIKTPTYKMI
jgi:hypothetical protein